ncbi:hypothetical protein JNM05_16015 [bacterium]|nr:hypothetical protein [bacterium]
MIKRNEVKYSGKFYIQSIVTILSVLLVVNIFFLIFALSFFSIIPIIVQTSVLYMIYVKHRNVANWIRGWCVLLMISGGMKLLSLVLRTFDYTSFGNKDAFVADTMLDSGFRISLLIIGAIYYILADDYIKPDFDTLKESQ